MRPWVESYKLIPQYIGTQGLLRLNSDVSDIPQQHQLEICPHILLMVMGAIQQGGVGCACETNVLVKSLI